MEAGAQLRHSARAGDVRTTGAASNSSPARDIKGDQITIVINPPAASGEEYIAGGGIDHHFSGAAGDFGA